MGARIQAETERPADLELDLSGLRFIDLAGLSVLWEAAQRLEAHGKSLTLVAPPPFVVRMVTVLEWHEMEGLRVHAPAV